jgi:dTDP-4-dehydrorhamnose 3,5-epimerase
MNFIKTEIDGIYLIEPVIFKDERGIFTKIFNKELFKQFNIENDFQESYYSISKKNVIRGMHFQLPPYDHSKLIYVVSGSIIDVVIDIRKKSNTYGKFIINELSCFNKKIIYIPRGFAHGFAVKSCDEALVVYMQTSIYNQEHDSGIRYDSFGYNWNIANPIISKRDSNFSTLNKFNSSF